jgi:hypothetical protein
MPSSGSSPSWKAQQKHILRIVGLMLAVINTSDNHPSKGLYPDSFNDFTPEQASNEDVYALFATFVAKEYVTGRGVATEKTFLSPDVARSTTYARSSRSGSPCSATPARKRSTSSRASIRTPTTRRRRG